MLNKLNGIYERFEELGRLLSDPKIALDYNKVAELAQERSGLEEIVVQYLDYRETTKAIADAQEMLSLDDLEMRELAQEELAAMEQHKTALDSSITRLLLPKDPRDGKNVIMEIRAGAGGDEAAIFASDLFRLYTRYAEANNWKTELVDSNETGVGGFKSVTFIIKGKGAFSRLKYESGVHRVQRVPVTESQGRVHTSTATVAVLAEVDDVSIVIDEKDLQIDTFRAGGAGGQNVQKNETAIRITHIPSGLVVQCQDERSKTQNILRGMSILKARLFDMEQKRVQDEQDEKRRSLIGSGDRAEKIRTYNYPQNRITDHRIGISLYTLQSFMDGAIDELIDEIATQDEAERLQHAGI